MATPRNVVHLNQPREGRGVEGVKLPLAVIKLRDRCAGHIGKLIQRLFQAVDDNLFERAEKAGSNAEQTHFFDAMREIRMQKDRVQALCLQGVTEDFKFARRAREKMEAAFDAENLSLVQHDALEQQVAAEHMVRRTLEANQRELEHLSLRLDAIIPNARVEESNNPLGPERLVQNFMSASEGLDISIESRLVLYKLFEKQVLSQCGKVYEAANKYLIEQGVMPDLHSVRPGGMRKGPGAPVGGAGGHVIDGNSGAVHSAADLGAQGQGEAYGGGDTFEMLRHLLAHQTGGLHTGAVHTGSPAGGSGVSGGTRLPVMPQQTLLQVLSAAQQQYINQAVTQPLNYAQIVESNDQSTKTRVGPMDQDVMNLVSMLFEYILSDRNMPVKIKALLGRLQIPLLKVAILDRSFFSKNGHSARRLLNELASSAIGWTEVEKGEDPFLTRIESIVDTLVNDFEDDLTLFDQILEEFLVFAEGEKKRRRLLEQRLCDAEAGKARSDMARKTVQKALNSVLDGRQVPALVLNTLHQSWSNYLVLLCLKNGESSPAFAAGVTVARTLVEGVLEEEGLEPMGVDAIQSLIGRMQEGLSEASVPEFEKRRVLGKLEALLMEVSQRRIVATLEVEEDFLNLDPGAELNPGVDELSSPETAAGTVGAPEAGPGREEDSPVQLLDQEGIKQVDDADRITVEGRVALVEEEPEEAVEPDNVADEGLMKQVDALQVGCWVEIRESEEKRYRARLAAIIQSSGKYIFANRLGMKVAEKGRIGLAMAFKHGSIVVLDNSQLFDRALESVIGSLRGGKVN